MVYSTDESKWRAYQFSDPFAAGSFVVCNKINSHFCRPDCDAHPITELHSEIKFVESPNDAARLGFSPCKSCDPMSVPSIDVNLLLVTVKEINAMIGFVPPLLDDDENKVTETIKENIMCQSSVQRRMSVPANAFSNKTATSLKPSAGVVSKNDSEHYRLIDLACRHLALAAAMSIFNGPGASAGSSPRSDDSSSGGAKKKGGKKRRGGVLGFKELATKSKLSAWHFHRVFKSIIGLTPKTYGDMCWEFLEKEKDAMDAGETPARKPSSVSLLADSERLAVGGSEHGSTSGSVAGPGPVSEPAPLSMAPAATTPQLSEEPCPFELPESYLTPPQTALFASPGSGQKRTHAEDMMPSPKKTTHDMASPQLNLFNDLRLDDDLDAYSGLNTRAISVPNLSTYGAAAGSLFSHSRNFDFFVNRQEMPSTDSVLAAAAPANEQVEYPNTYDISPASIEDISPLNGSAMISPEVMPTSDFPFAMGDSKISSDFTLAVDPINENQMFSNMDVLPDLFKTQNEYATDYSLNDHSLNDPLLSGLAPELMPNIDF